MVQDKERVSTSFQEPKLAWMKFCVLKREPQIMLMSTKELSSIVFKCIMDYNNVLIYNAFDIIIKLLDLQCNFTMHFGTNKAIFFLGNEETWRLFANEKLVF